MSYTKRWAGGFFDLPSTATPIDSAFLNAVETALLKLQSVDPTADGQVLQWDNANTRYGPALILNKNIGAGAAIDKSKLNLTGQITNADIAAGAAIDASKVNFGATIAGRGFTISTWSGGPPGSPVDGDIWVATAVDANGTRWQFQYNAGSASTYKWEFIGGSQLSLAYKAGGISWNNAAFTLVTIGGTWYFYHLVTTWVAARAGDYYMLGHQSGQANTANAVIPALTPVVAGSVYTGNASSTSSSAPVSGYWYTMPFDALVTGVTAGQEIGMAWQWPASSIIDDTSVRIVPKRII